MNLQLLHLISYDRRQKKWEELEIQSWDVHTIFQKKELKFSCLRQFMVFLWVDSSLPDGEIVAEFDRKLDSD